ncbi:MAG: FAD-dependent oxidoreductase [Pseudomonadota bacterium]
MAVAIIGAGLAGLTCADGLKARGADVVLFDKGRGPGGRMSTRRAETVLGQVRFDHGAQYISAISPIFSEQLALWDQSGYLVRWQGRFVEIDAHGAVRHAAPKPRWVGVPAMNSLIKALAEPLDVSWGARVEALQGGPGSWTLEFEDGCSAAGPFEAVILAIPAEQVGALLDGVAPEMSRVAASVVSAPSWTTMVAFEDSLACDFEAARIDGSPMGWIACNTSKPERGRAETWVIQASRDWSRDHLEDPAEDVTRALLETFIQLTGAPAPVHAASHRWRFAQAETPAGISHQFDESLTLGTCGDWHLGGQCEQAWLSGRALAKAISF